MDRFDSSNKEEKLSIISNMTKISDEKIIEKIISLLDDSDIRIRGESFSTLFLNHHDISQQLIQNLSNQSDNIRAFCSLILANRKNQNAINSIKKLTNDPNSMVRSCALGALGYLRAKNAREEFHQGIFDSNIDVKKSAAYALVLINEKISNAERIELEKQQDSDFKKILKKL